MKKLIIFFVALVAVFFFLGKDLNPFDPHLFIFHDNTQAARLQEFALNIKNGIIPPRLAPHFSFDHGFPVFNFYAPFAYWVGTLIHLTGISSAISLKILILFGLLTSYISFFLFASVFVGFWGGILGASIYSSSLWMAVEIFVRGNVGEIWFMALFPLSFYLMKRNDTEKSGLIFALTTMCLSFLFTVHNVLSLVSVILLILLSLILTNKKKAFASLFLGLLLSSYFLVPAVLENRLTYASEIASRTKYADHFLCPWQLWKAEKWSYGGSGIGCLNDDMSFQVGKLQLILGAVGFGIFLFTLKNKGDKSFSFFVFRLTVLSALLTLSVSKPVWDLFAPLMSMFQFPWRFLPFVVFGVAYFSSFLVDITANRKLQIFIAVFLIFTTLYISSKYFSKPWKFTADEYQSTYLTEKYIEKKAAFEIPEYFPRVGDYKTWRLYDKSETGFSSETLTYKINGLFYKEIVTDKELITLPVHYFPFWEIKINGAKIIPTNFDTLGRPILSIPSPHSIVVVRYNESLIEKLGTIISIFSMMVLLLVSSNKKLWKKMNAILQ